MKSMKVMLKDGWDSHIVNDQDLAEWDESAVAEANQRCRTSKTHGKNTGLEGPLRETGKAFEYFYRNDPFYDCSVKTKREFKDETWKENNPQTEHLIILCSFQDLASRCN